MAIHTIDAIQCIPAGIDAVWDLFSNPQKLKEITPAAMNFRVTSVDDHVKIFTGQLIEYKVSPLFNIPLYWKTEIVDVQDRVSFIDEQRKGPYSLWRHEHYFSIITGGVEMKDLVTYKLPLGFIGDIAHTMLVKEKLQGIFEFRFKKISEIFGAWPGQRSNILIR